MSISEQLTIFRLQSFESTEFRQLFGIYAEAIPESERKSIRALQEMLRNPLCLFLVAKIDDSVVGFSIVREFEGTSACLLEYMAVEREKRGCGIGRSLFRRAWEFSNRIMLLEVDSDGIDTPQREIRTKRKAFYRNLGCREIEALHFAMPSVTAEPPPAMELLVFQHELPKDIDKQRVLEWLQCIYAEVYGQRIDDFRIHAMLAGLPERVQLI